MTNKEWMEQNADWIEAIRNRILVMGRDSEDEEWSCNTTPCGFTLDSPRGFYFLTYDGPYRYWKPTKKVLKAKGPIEIMNILVGSGYSPDAYGNWYLKGSPRLIFFKCGMWGECGKDLSKTTYEWQPEWTEESEE